MIELFNKAAVWTNLLYFLKSCDIIKVYSDAGMHRTERYLRRTCFFDFLYFLKASFFFIAGSSRYER